MLENYSSLKSAKGNVRLDPMTPEPVVKLENYFKDPFDNAVATARTCVVPRMKRPEPCVSFKRPISA